MKKKQLEQRKAELKKELNQIEDGLENIFQAENFPKFEKEYNDTYWRYKSSYGSAYNNKKWFVYTHVKKITSVWDTGGNGPNCYVLMDTFEMRIDNQFIACLNKEDYYFHLEQKITRKQFETAVNKMITLVREAAMKPGTTLKELAIPPKETK